MKILRNISLRNHNTFGLDYKADNLISINTEKEAIDIFSGELTVKKPVTVIGDGSNILFIRDYEGTLITSGIKGIRICRIEDNSVIVSAGSGIAWDKLVDWCVRKGFSGIENLSLIPGKTGAAAVQNIGAYGVEAKDVIVKVRAISTWDGSVRHFTNEECCFGYRDSIFKRKEKGKYFITRIWLKLSTRGEFRLNYGTLATEVKKMGTPTLANVRSAVVAIRREKLPDPAVTGNAGSFFKNPVLKYETAQKLFLKYPGIVHYPDKPGYIKLAAGWLIEYCGWKGKRNGDAGVHSKQSLVIINLGNATGAEILKLADEIRESVFGEFGVVLEHEVEVI